jgi:DNA uptake protein ComE-like DNA-binding protein
MKVTLSSKRKISIIDINKATQEELIKIYGIGDVISLRILKLKKILELCVYGADE